MENRKPSALSKPRANQHVKSSRTETLYVRLTPEEMRKVDLKAGETGQSRSDVVRAALFRLKLKDNSPERLELRKNLIRACGNLNQCMKHLNTYGYEQSYMKKALEIIDWFHELRNSHAEV